MGKGNELIVKKVQFNGDDLVAAQDASQQVWVGVTWVMRALGFNDEKAKRERKSMKEDRVLGESIKYLNFGAYANGHEVMCIPLQRLPLWAAKISVTPGMRKAQPRIAEKLYRYQMDAADVLAKEFLPETEPAELVPEPASGRSEERAVVSVNMPDYSDRLDNLQRQVDHMTEILTDELKEINKNLVRALNTHFTDNKPSKKDRPVDRSQERTETADQSGFALWRKSLENRIIRCMKYNVYDSCHELFEDIRWQIGCDDVNMLDVYEDVALRSRFEKKLDQVIYNESVRDRFCQMDEAVADAYARKGGKITQAWVWHTAYMHMSDVDWEQEIEDFCDTYDRDPVNKKELIAYSEVLYEQFIDAAESI